MTNYRIPDAHKIQLTANVVHWL